MSRALFPVPKRLNEKWMDMKLNRFRTVSAVVGAGAVLALGALSAALPATQAHAGSTLPQHFGGPVNTSIDNPPADLGVPTVATSANAPLNAPVPPGTVVGTQ
jgi:hypothetical protein